MHLNRHKLLVAACISICLASIVAADEISMIKEVGIEEIDGFSILGHEFEYTAIYKDWIQSHVEIALRYSDYNYTRRHESGPGDPYFIGSNDSIKAEDPGLGLQNLSLSWFPWAGSSKRVDSRLYGLFRVLECIGIELGWDHLRAKTVTSATAERPAYSDGTIIVKGPIISYVAKIENPSIISPYFGLGTIFYHDASVTQDWWHYGFGSEGDYEQWRNAGSPGDPNSGWRRTFHVSDKEGLCWYAGAVIEIDPNWKLDLFYRKTDVVFDNSYRISSRGRVVEERKSKWDLSNETYGLGLRYAF